MKEIQSLIKIINVICIRRKEGKVIKAGKIYSHQGF